MYDYYERVAPAQAHVFALLGKNNALFEVASTRLWGAELEIYGLVKI
jgi:hypothetical protein